MKPKQIKLLPNSQIQVTYDTEKTEIKNARGLPFNPDMMKANFEGTKTQTRRVIKDLKEGPKFWFTYKKLKHKIWKDDLILLFSEKPGDLIYCRETFYEWGYWCPVWSGSKHYRHRATRNTKKWLGYYWRKKLSIHMPREAARLWLILESIKIERVQDINEEDCLREGIDMETKFGSLCISIETAPYKNDLVNGSAIKTVFKDLWDSINANRKDKHGNLLHYAWKDNPWVLVRQYRKFYEGRAVA